MRIQAVVLAACAACGGRGTGDDPDAGPALALEVPDVIALPYVIAGDGAVMLDVEVRNAGTAVLHPVWQLDGDADFTIADAPALLAGGELGRLTLRWTGAASPRIAGATLAVDSEAGVDAAEVWGVAGDPLLGDATFEPVTGAGGVPIGTSAVVQMPTAPYPAPGDDRVHLFVPDGYRERVAQDVVLHFHGHNTTIASTVPAHRYREQVYASGADVILAVPQRPVNQASGDFGQLGDPAGTTAFLDEVLTVLYRAGTITRPVLGDLTLTSHSGGYAAVAANLALARQVDLFDSLYGFVSSYRDFAQGGGLLRSNYTSGGGTDANNQALAADLGAADAPTQGNLRDAPAVIYFTAADHNGATRDDGAFGEQLRWGARHSRRGPRIELRSVTAAASGDARVTWLAPPDDEVTGLRVEREVDGRWITAATVAATATEASISVDDGARVRVIAVGGELSSDVYRVDRGADILVVDGFDRTIDGSWGGLFHDFAARVGEDAGAVHTVSSEAITEAGFALAPYRVVIWLLGDESSQDHTFTADERAAVDAYLDGGGHLVVSGSEVGFDLGGSTAGASFLARTAGAVHAADDAGTTSAHGVGALAALPAFAFGGSAAPYAEEFPDTFTATTGGVVVLAYATGAAAAVGIAGQSVLVGFPLEVIDSPADRAAVVAALLDFAAP